jgi:4-aminobutyrate aminotransferase/(S)-3-amino-2-methylpropionate transaminase
MASNAELMSRRGAAVPRGVSSNVPIAVARAENAEVWDVAGKRYLDFTGGIAVLNTGHRHPKVTAAAINQIEKYTHTCFQVLTYEPYVELAEKLNALAPGDFAKKSVLFTTGAEAVENAIKIARAYTRRSAVIAFSGGYHGRTLLTLALTGKVQPYKAGFGPFPAEIFHAQYPDPLRGVGVEQAMASIQTLFRDDIEPLRVAAIILEPVQGEGGFHVAPPGFLVRLRSLCDEHGILLVADEIQTGFGRTGKMFAIEHSGVAPDLLTLGKSLAGGFPLSAVVGRAEVMDAPEPGGLGGTYAGSPTACAAALAVLKVFEEEQLLDRATGMGTRLMSGLVDIAKKHKIIGDVRGLGAMIAFELFHAGDPTRPAPELARALVARASEKGLLLLSCGKFGNVIRLLPPLTTSNTQIEEGLIHIAESLSELEIDFWNETTDA